MKRPLVKVDFGESRHEGQVRAVWHLFDCIQFTMRELLTAKRPREKDRWLREVKQEYKKLGQIISQFQLDTPRRK